MLINNNVYNTNTQKSLPFEMIFSLCQISREGHVNSTFLVKIRIIYNYFYYDSVDLTSIEFSII